MLSQDRIDIIKSTVPLLEGAGTALTDHFYRRMFEHNPELQHVFNMSHQKTGAQAVALFGALAAYAKNIDNPAVLTQAVERIAHKHTSFNIQPDQYAIVGHHLLETLRELAGEAFTPEVEDAWGAAYGVLASMFIDLEAGLYKDNADKAGGWQGARRFKVVDKRAESALVTSLVFEAVDGGLVADFKPGQYIGVKVSPVQGGYDEIRQYSLSGAPHSTQYRISVKRETTPYEGVVSNYIHDQLQLGAEVDLFSPAGDFFFVDRQSPVVLVSAGVGLTPMQSMLESLVDCSYEHPVHYLHACESIEQHSFASSNYQLQQKHGFSQYLWYRTHEEAVETEARLGTMQVADVAEQLPLEQGHFYICGPVPFMAAIKQQLVDLAVDQARIHYEVFGPHQTL